MNGDQGDKFNVCNRCGFRRKSARTRVQYPLAFICNQCYRAWKRAAA